MFHTSLVNKVLINNHDNHLIIKFLAFKPFKKIKTILYKITYLSYKFILNHNFQIN